MTTARVFLAVWFAVFSWAVVFVLRRVRQLIHTWFDQQQRSEINL